MAYNVFAVSVDFYDEQQNNGSAVGMRIRVNNDSGAPITDAKLRYYFRRSSSQYAVDGYYLAGATMAVNDMNDGLAYIELDIPSIPQGYFPDLAGFSLVLHHADWLPWEKDSDYSYIGASGFTENSRIVLLSGDEIVYGEPPVSASRPRQSRLTFSGIKFSDNSWIEIRNIGSSTAQMADYSLVVGDNIVCSVGSDSLDVGEMMRICQNRADCDSVEKSIVIPGFVWNDSGEVFLKRDSTLVSYMAWGQPGSRADEAAELGLWEDPRAYFPSAIHVEELNANYNRNVFFRLMPQKDASDIGNWFSFSSNDDLARIFPTPLPVRLSANRPVIKRIPGENDILFSWAPVNGIGEYRFILRDRNQNVIFDRRTANTSLSLPLVQGDYSWTVLGGDGYDASGRQYENADGSFSSQIFENIGIEDADINTGIYRQLQIHQIAARRDTRMLNLGYMEDSYLYSWDRPNLDATGYEPQEDSRCWVVAVEVLNHYYGGNLTQDEIAYRTNFREDDPLLSPLFKDGAVMANKETGELTGKIAKAMRWTLRTDELGYHAGAPSYAVVRNAIDNGKPVYVGFHEHAMVIYGYVGDADNYAYYYAFMDNDGHVGNSLFYDKPILEYAIPDVVYGDVEMTDARIYMDSDFDGITDFEEEERFHTDPYLADTDNDGIEDKREIYDYTVAAENTAKLLSNPYHRYVEGSDGKMHENPIYETFNKIYNKADYDKDDVYAERDPDNDGDGIEDGLKGGANVIRMDVPEDYTIFGREYVRINDGVKCFNTQAESDSYCNVASSDENIFSYDLSYEPVNIGARAHVGKVDFRVAATLKGHSVKKLKSTVRSSAVVHGGVSVFAAPKLYGSPEFSDLVNRLGSIEEAQIAYLQLFDIADYFTVQQGASIEGEARLLHQQDWKRDYTYEFDCAVPKISESRNKVVRNGETYRLSDGDAFSTLRVESGATLIVEAGTMYVDKLLQVEPGATVYFAEPGKGTVLHTNGKIIWRPYNSIDPSDTQYWVNAARGFKLAHHSSQGFYIEGQWAGTIFAPKAKVVLGQVNKTVYGRFLARDVIVHQYARVFRVDFDPVDAMQVADVAY